ncbi:hypothetical protein PQR57_47950, partial [Paraburkholderia dipogonis]
RTGATPTDRHEFKERPTPYRTQPKNPNNAKSHYLNPTLTYWSFLKNRPTIQPNTQSAAAKGKQSQPCAAPKATAKKPETKPTMPKTQRQHHARDTASNPGPISGPAL